MRALRLHNLCLLHRLKPNNPAPGRKRRKGKEKEEEKHRVLGGLRPTPVVASCYPDCHADSPEFAGFLSGLCHE